jgi:polygalacturonase
MIDPRAHGACADGRTNDTAAIQEAIDAAHAGGGGRVFLAGGVFRAATLFLKSNVTLEVAAGAKLEAIADPELYPFIQPGVCSRMDTVAWRAFLYACDADNVTVRGEGEIIGHGEDEAFKKDLKGNDPRRPYGMHFVGCRNVRIQGLRLRDSAFWMIRCLSCAGVAIRDLDIWNHADTRNNDGCDIDGCRDVIVSGCRIDSCDDALCLKSEGKDLCENVSISNCVLASFASPLKFGTGSIGGFRNISVGNITIRRSSCSRNHHVFQADGGLAGIDVGCVDGGIFENVTISNVAMRGPETPIFIKLGKRHSFNCHDGQWPDMPEVKEGTIRGLRISHLTAQDVGPYPCIVLGYPGNPVRDVSFSDMRIEMGQAAADSAGWETVQVAPEAYPVNRNIDSLTPAYGLFACHAQNLRLRDVQFVPADGEVRSAIALDNVQDFDCQGVLTPGSDEDLVIRR